jgi:deoxyhypusine synthase
MCTVSDFIDKNFKHFNAATLTDAAQAYRKLIDDGGKMLVSIGGAMSTAEIGNTLAEMIYAQKVHAICCTGANLEEDIFYALRPNDYRRVAWKSASPFADAALSTNGLYRVLDTCIPECAMDEMTSALDVEWQKAQFEQTAKFPHEYLFDAIRNKEFIPKHRSWVVAAMDCKIPIFIPCWTDSTLGNAFVARVYSSIFSSSIMKTSTDYLMALLDWYKDTRPSAPIGFFQIGGGIAGDFALSAVPLINQELASLDSTVVKYPLWSYFCNITDAVESYGGYSGAGGSEKISWAKLERSTPMFTINSDATIVAPLIFAYVMGW